MTGFLATPMGQLAQVVGETLALLVPLLIIVAFLTYAERKILAAIQIRKGPNVVGPFGLMQPFADALKMMMKETVIPSGANPLLFLFAFWGIYYKKEIPPLANELGQLLTVTILSGACFGMPTAMVSDGRTSVSRPATVPNGNRHVRSCRRLIAGVLLICPPQPLALPWPIRP